MKTRTTTFVATTHPEYFPGIFSPRENLPAVQKLSETCGATSSPGVRGLPMKLEYHSPVEHLKIVAVRRASRSDQRRT